MRFPRKSILARIISLHVFALCVAAIVMPLAIYVLLRLNADGLEQRRLHARARLIASTLEPRGPGAWHTNMDPTTLSLYERGFSGLAFSVTNKAGDVALAAPKVVNDVIASAPRDPAITYFEHTEGVAVYYGISMPYHIGRETLWIIVTQNLESPDIIVDDVVAGVLKRASLIAVVMFTVILVFDLIILRRALQPVVAASQTAAGIDPKRLGTRLPTDSLPVEVFPLANAVNEALSRIEAGYRVQQDFSSDTAHELRTPLAILRMRIEALDQGPTRAALLNDVEKMSRIVDQLLQLAELESSVDSLSGVVDLHAIAAEVVGETAPLAIARDQLLSLAEDTKPVPAIGQHELIGRALRNLIENAIIHTPAGSKVEVYVRSDGRISVADNGPGIADDRRLLVFDRFWRGDRSKRQGSGLGLSIVGKIAEMHGGTVVVDSPAGQGAVFTLDLRSAVSRISGMATEPART